MNDWSFLRTYIEVTFEGYPMVLAFDFIQHLLHL